MSIRDLEDLFGPLYEGGGYIITFLGADSGFSFKDIMAIAIDNFSSWSGGGQTT